MVGAAKRLLVTRTTRPAPGTDRASHNLDTFIAAVRQAGPTRRRQR
jgi:hypothetical protein